MSAPATFSVALAGETATAQLMAEIAERTRVETALRQRSAELSAANNAPGTVSTTLLPVEVIRPTSMSPVFSVNQTLPLAVAMTDPEPVTSISSNPTSPMPPLVAFRVTVLAEMMSAASVLLPSIMAPGVSIRTPPVDEVMVSVRKSPVCSASQISPLAVAVTLRLSARSISSPSAAPIEPLVAVSTMARLALAGSFECADGRRGCKEAGHE